MTPYDKQKIEQALMEIDRKANEVLALVDGRQRLSPGDRQLVKYEYDNLRSPLRGGVGGHVFESESGRHFAIRSGDLIGSEFSASSSDSPDSIASSLRGLKSGISYRLMQLSKCQVAD